MELKRQKQVHIERARQEALYDPFTETHRNPTVPTCIPKFEDPQSIRILRPGIVAENVGYRKVLGFQDD